jgi:Tol biopolymer transport system component
VRILLALVAALLLLSVGSGATASSTTPPRNGLIAVYGPKGISVVDPRTGTTKLLPDTFATIDPAWSPDGKLLAVTSNPGDAVYSMKPDYLGYGFAVYTMKPDGSQRKLVVENAHSPSWSPDGKQLVVVQESAEPDAETNSLAIVNADGSGAHTLDVDAGRNFDVVSAPEWSPDGKLIAFVDGDQSIRLVSPDGKAAPIPPAATEGNGLSWSPDSTKLAFDRYVDSKVGGRLVAVVLDVATGRETVFKGEQNGAQSPVWSPEGDQLAFLSLSERTTPSTTFHSCGGDAFVSQLWVMAPDGTKAHRLVEGEYYGPPSWARSLEPADAPPADSEPEQPPLPAPPADTAPEPLPAPSADTAPEQQPLPAPAADEAPAAKAPVLAKRLASSASTDGLIAVRGSDALYLTNPDSGSTRKIPDTSDMVAPAWSPDAKLLAVERVGKSESSIWTIRPDGTDPRLVLPNASLPSWSPAGDRIYAVRNECTTPCEPEDEADNVLFSVRTDGEDVRKVEYEEDVDREFAWAPDGDAIGFFADENASDPGTFDSDAATWSPDGFWVAFVGAVGPFDDEAATAPPPYGLWVVSAEGGTPRLLVKGASGRPSWAR